MKTSLTINFVLNKLPVNNFTKAYLFHLFTYNKSELVIDKAACPCPLKLTFDGLFCYFTCIYGKL